MDHSRHIIIVGFGLSGRASADAAAQQGVSYTIIESNRETAERCSKFGLNIIVGDAREPNCLKDAGIDRATDIAVTVPSDEVTLQVVELARKLAPNARIVARCTFVSGGLEATRKGASEVVIAEQVVAAEFGRIMSGSPAEIEVTR